MTRPKHRGAPAPPARLMPAANPDLARCRAKLKSSFPVIENPGLFSEDRVEDPG